MQSLLPTKPKLHQAGRAKQALLYIKEFLENYRDEKVKHGFYLGFSRGLLAAQLVERYISKDGSLFTRATAFFQHSTQR